MQQTKLTPENYINSLPDNRKQIIETLDKIIAPIFDKADRYLLEGKFWGGSEQQILSYGRYSYTRSDKKKVDWLIIGLANQKGYVSIFVSASDGKQYLIEKYKNDLGKVEAKTSRIKLKKIEDLNLENFAKLIKEAKEIMEKN